LWRPYYEYGCGYDDYDFETCVHAKQPDLLPLRRLWQELQPRDFYCESSGYWRNGR
jgi:hypothetical protein